jgi:hypothetical protein
MQILKTLRYNGASLLMKLFTIPRILLVLALGLLTACALPGVDTAPTPFPPDFFPTVVALTGQAAMATSQAGLPSEIPTQPSATPTGTDTLIPPTLSPTETPTATPSGRSAQIQIQAPGPMSKVTSPLQLRMLVVSGSSKLVQIDLQGEDGRMLARTLKRVPTEIGGYYVSMKIPFEIRAAAELGRLTISTKDSQGRLQSLTAQHVLLLSVGSADIFPTGEIPERVVLYMPKNNAVATGGNLYIEGRYMPLNDQPIVLELLNAEGNTIGLRVLDLAGVAEQDIETSIPYKVAETTEARLVIRQDDDRIVGYMYWYSQLVTLMP